MLRTARSKFVNGPQRAAFEAIVASPAFEEATLAALLELQSDMPLVTSPNQAADCHNMMAGARRYLEVLCSIHLPETKPKSSKSQELNWDAGV
jgi:hypothetical protein